MGTQVAFGIAALLMAAATGWSQQGGSANSVESPVPMNLWGIDLLLSNSGFGLGVSYRRQYTEDLAGQVALSVSESKEDREVEYYDPITGNSFVPGKLSRFMVIPLTVGLQYRLFREDIVETFRPYVNAGLGPTMIYVMPFVKVTPNPAGSPTIEQVEFFRAIGQGTSHFTAGGFIGAGAYFGSERSNILGINIRYYINYLLSGGLPSQYNQASGAVTATKSSYGGFYITLNIGVGGS
jgi:hypothetical protein